MAVKLLPPLELLRQYYRYDPELGLIFNNKNKKISSEPFKNSVSYWSYRSIRFNRIRYYYHRLAWFLYYGEDPADSVIDHIDGNIYNNKINNLRCVSHAENMKNKRDRRKERSVLLLRRLRQEI